MMISDVSVADLTGEDLLVIRRTLGMSSADFAAELGISVMNVELLELDGRSRRVPLRVARKLLEATSGEAWDEAVHRVLETDTLLAEIRESLEQADFDRYDPSADTEPPSDRVQSDIE